MYAEDRILQNIDRDNSVGKSIISNDFQKKIDDWKKSDAQMKYEQFLKIYRPEEITKDQDYEKRKIARFSAQEEHGRSDEAIAAEYVVAELISKQKAFGNEVQKIILTTKYDDLMGIDSVVCFETKDGLKNYLGIDVTINPWGLSEKIYDVLKFIKEFKLHHVKYFRHGNQIGVDVPRVSIGLTREKIQEILMSKNKKNEDKTSPEINEVILQEAVDQLYFQLFYLMKQIKNKYVVEFGDLKTTLEKDKDVGFEDIESAIKECDRLKSNLKNEKLLNMLEAYRNSLWFLYRAEKGVGRKKIDDPFLKITSKKSSYEIHSI